MALKISSLSYAVATCTQQHQSHLSTHYIDSGHPALPGPLSETQSGNMVHRGCSPSPSTNKLYRVVVNYLSVLQKLLSSSLQQNITPQKHKYFRSNICQSMKELYETLTMLFLTVQRDFNSSNSNKFSAECQTWWHLRLFRLVCSFLFLRYGHTQQASPAS